MGNTDDGSASISITADAELQSWEVVVNDGASVPWLSFLRSTNRIESIAISTKRHIATQISPEVDRVEGDLPISFPYGVEEPTPLRTVDIRSVSIRPVESGRADLGST